MSVWVSKDTPFRRTNFRAVFGLPRGLRAITIQVIWLLLFQTFIFYHYQVIWLYSNDCDDTWWRAWAVRAATRRYCQCGWGRRYGPGRCSAPAACARRHRSADSSAPTRPTRAFSSRPTASDWDWRAAPRPAICSTAIWCRRTPTRPAPYAGYASYSPLLHLLSIITSISY